MSEAEAASDVSSCSAKKLHRNDITLKQLRDIHSLKYLYFIILHLTYDLSLSSNSTNRNSTVPHTFSHQAFHQDLQASNITLSAFNLTLRYSYTDGDKQ